MVRKLFGMILIISLLTSCMSVPNETVILSQTIGNDIKILEQSHINIINMHFGKIKDDINAYIDDVYAPFIIQYVLKADLKNKKIGKKSLFTTIEMAGTIGGKKRTQAAINEMSEFQFSAMNQINKKRNELLLPIIIKESEITTAVKKSYLNLSHANTTLTSYLQSLRKLKEAQKSALSIVGLEDADGKVAKSLIEMSDGVKKVLEGARKIDIKSDGAIKKINKASRQFKQFIK